MCVCVCVYMVRTHTIFISTDFRYIKSINNYSYCAIYLNSRTYLLNENLYPVTNICPFLHPQSLASTILLSVLMILTRFLFRFHIYVNSYNIYPSLFGLPDLMSFRLIIVDMWILYVNNRHIIWIVIISELIISPCKSTFCFV